MSKQTILVPTCAIGPTRTKFEVDLINELAVIDEREWSERERRLMDEASSFGELYQMTIEEVIGEHESYFELRTDLGQPEAFLIVRVPLNIDRPKIIMLVQKMAEDLC